MTTAGKENIHTQFGETISQVCKSKGLPLPMATEFNTQSGMFRMHMRYDPRIAKQVAATGKVILRDILDALEQKDVELAKKMVRREISVL